MKNKTLLQTLVAIVLVAMWGYVTFLQFEIINKGVRNDPFRCSDATHYFGKLGIKVDCARIDNEVNEKK